MSVPMKKHPIEKAKIKWRGANYSVPVKVLALYKTSRHREDLSVDDVFGDLIREYTEPGLLLKGLRHREGLSQLEFAKILNISQTNLSAMENGKRTIGKELAKRIANHFRIDYRIFL